MEPVDLAHGDRSAKQGAGKPRLLLVKLGAIGDVIMAIPAAASRHSAGYQVDWVCSEAVAPVLRCYPWIYVIAVDEPKLLRGALQERVGGMLRLWQRLQERSKDVGGYETIATLYYDARYRLLTLPLRARRKIHLSRTDRAKALLPGRHHTEEYDRILSGRTDGELPERLSPVPIPDLPPAPLPLREGAPRVVLVPAGARNALRDDALRRWPVEQYVRLAELLLAAGCEVVLAGGPDDRWASQHFSEVGANAPAGCFADLTGSCTLLETLGLLNSAEVTVTHDTGPLHLAGITSTAIVTLFGPTDPHGRLPQKGNAVAIWGGSGFACRPCYDGRDYAPCAHNGCMAQITPEEVAKEVLSLVQARRTGCRLPPRICAPEADGLAIVPSGGGEP